MVNIELLVLFQPENKNIGQNRAIFGEMRTNCLFCSLFQLQDILCLDDIWYYIFLISILSSSKVKNSVLVEVSFWPHSSVGSSFHPVCDTWLIFEFVLFSFWMGLLRKPQSRSL